MLYNLEDSRQPLETGSVIEFPNNNKYIIDKYIGRGGFALTYIAHLRETSKYVILKELFPKRISGGIAVRGKDGKIEIRDPLTRDIIHGNEGAWKRLSGYFVREAKLTEKASAVYDLDGEKEVQNSPDVFTVVGPYGDKIGNLYLVIDTVQGYPLRNTIEEGFVKDESGHVLSNGNLLDIIGVLRDTSRILSYLHESGRLFHLDISPDNIYVYRSSSETGLTPRIIDFGSAFDREKKKDSSYVFTCNPFSAPEIMALAEFNDQDCGYQVGAFSDTYAIVSILFYALTGSIYSPDLAFSSRWKESLWEEYTVGKDINGRPLDSGSAEFTEKLIEILERGLSADTGKRYQTADALFKELSRLYQLYQTSGNLLALLPKDELMSYLILDKYPLYDYRSISGNLDVLCLGSGEFGMRMILSMLSCGQMLNCHLNIHVVSQETRDSFCDRLLSVAPDLRKYSNLIENVPEDLEYVSFEFETVQDLTRPEDCGRIALKYGFCRYVIVSLGSNCTNIDVARLYAKNISQNPKETDKKTVIHYYLAEDAADNRRSGVTLEGISPQIELEPFNNGLSSFASGLRTLGQRALRVKHLYDKIQNPRCKYSESAQSFVSDAYQQRSSCAAALHLPYKLASVGIYPTQNTNQEAIISAYVKLDGSRRNALLELEHRRWMMYMIADGYRFPTAMSQIETYAFCEKNGRFNASFHDKTDHWHHCLVPCSTKGICLSSDKAEWNRYSTYEEIEKTNYDKLDQMSLKVHLLAKKRTEDPNVKKNLKDDLENKIGAKIKQRAHILREIAEEEHIPEDIQKENEQRLDVLQQRFLELSVAMSTAASTHHCKEQQTKLDALESEFEKVGIDASSGFQTVREDLKIFLEFENYVDYKASDLNIIKYLLWLMYADKNMVLIKLAAKAVLDNILGPLILTPKTLIFFGQETDHAIDTFLRLRGDFGTILFEPYSSGEADAVFRKLEQLRSRFPGKCAIDITGADETYIIAAVWLAAKDRDVALLRSSQADGKIENVSGFYKADIYQMNSCISAEEVYQLHGAVELSSDRGYMQELEQSAEILWDFYLEFQDSWEMVSAFFYNRGTGTPELKFTYAKDNSDMLPWRPYKRMVEASLWTSLKLEDCFSKMQEIGFIRELSVSSQDPQGVRISFQYRGNTAEPRNDFVLRGFNSFFTEKIWRALRPFTCTLQENDQNIYIALQSGSYVEIQDRKNTDFRDKRCQMDGDGKRFPYELAIPALQRLEQLGFITGLSFSVSTGEPPVNIKYTYRSLAIKDCLVTSGNILELFTWYAARRTGKFDDCKANFTFQWEQGVKNELDLVLTKGINTLVVSCKTAKFNKSHLYEIKYLTERFSLNSKAVIVYSSTQAIDENGHLTYDTSAVKERAKAMGVYLIPANGMNAENLGEELLKIAEGTSTLLYDLAEELQSEMTQSGGNNDVHSQSD